MRGVSFPEQTTDFGKPSGWKDEDCYSLPVGQSFYLNSEGYGVACLVSRWEQELTDEQIAEIVRTRRLSSYLTITGGGMPPVSISLDRPFTDDYDKERALEIHKKILEAQRQGKQIHHSNL